ncbi:MAG: transporter [Betaproteobacteria bacterium]|nr:transporter [Betaproteobacteria bacterium]
MRKLLSIFVAMIGLSLIAVDVEAKRVGGGRSVGTQRSITPQQAAPKAPAQQQATPNAPASAQGAATAPPPKPASGMSKWLGPLAGLAIGAGLASLFMGNGLGGALGGILLMLAIVVGVVFLIRMFRGRGAQPQQQPLRYAGATAYGGVEPTASPAPAPAPSYSGGGAAPHSIAATTSSAAPAAARRWPADFDADEFARHAKANFLKVQDAHDRRDLTAIRDFLTPALAAEIEADMRASGEAPQKTEVVTLDAEVLDVVTENNLYIVSVRFSGLIRETPGTDPQPFSEIWHLEKPLDGRSGWQVAGIQQA